MFKLRDYVMSPEPTEALALRQRLQEKREREIRESMNNALAYSRVLEASLRNPRPKTTTANLVVDADEFELAEVEPVKFVETKRKIGSYRLPTIRLLDKTEPVAINKREIGIQRQTIIVTLKRLNVDVEINKVIPAASTIKFLCRFIKSTGKVGKIEDIRKSLKDLALALGVTVILEPFVVGQPEVFALVISRVSRQQVLLRDAIEGTELKGVLPVPVGYTADGTFLGFDLVEAPHTLVAGSTGSGKSVFITSTIASLLMNHTPDSLRLLMIDVKGEFQKFEGLPHLLTEVITEPDNALAALLAVQAEMNRRKGLIGRFATLDAYNLEARHPLERIVVVIEELAELLESGNKEELLKVLGSIARLARSTGIHLIVGIQRPDADILRGEIKSNFPTRVAFKVMTVKDAEVVGITGAEKLNGKGDGFFRGNGIEQTRFQGAYTEPTDLKGIVAYWQGQPSARVLPIALNASVDAPQAITDTFEVIETVPVVLEAPKAVTGSVVNPDTVKAVELIKTQGKVSVRTLEKLLNVGRERAQLVLTDLIEMNLVSNEANGRGERQVL